MAVIALADYPGSGARPSVQWLRCVACFRGVVTNDGVVSPESKPFDVPKALPDADRAAWNEVRSCLAAGANTAAVMMSRKLLFHVAVAHGLPEKNENGRAPTFVQALDSLENAGVFTKTMRPWINRIKDVGNEASHELVAITESEAMDVARFTQQLLQLAYELPAMIGYDLPAAE